MLVLRLVSLTAAVLLAATPAAAAQVPSDDALACLLPQVGDGQGRPDGGKSERIDPKVADAAKTKSHKWWRSDETRAQLGITDAQSIEIEKIFQSFYAALKAGAADVDRYQKDVSKMLADASGSEVDVLQAINRLEASKADLGRTRTLMIFRMYRLLSPEQRIKVKRFQEQKDAAASSPR